MGVVTWIGLGMIAVASPANYEAELAPLRAPAPWHFEPGQTAVLPAFTSAAVHAEALRRDPLHHDRFVVEKILGDPQSSRVVFLIPQYHRNPLMPLGWTSLGAAIIEVQTNIDALVTRLVEAHGLRCVGTEGSWLARIELPFELKQAARWYHDLETERARTAQMFQREKWEGEDHVARIFQVLEEELKRYVALLDGVGVAMSRFPAYVQVHRFGVEDAALNTEALSLLRELRMIDEELANLDPHTQSAVADAMGQMWLAEIDDYRTQTLLPFAEAIGALDATRVRLRQMDASDAAETLGRYVSFAKHIAATVIQPDAIDSTTAYYERVAHGPKEVPAPNKRPIPPAARRRVKRLEARRAPLQKRYEEVTIAARDEAAAKRILRAVGSAGACGLVMGAAHQAGIESALLEASRGQIAIVVVTPYDFSDVAPQDAGPPPDAASVGF